MRVDWLIYDEATKTFVEYNWETQNQLECSSSFDGQFPVIAEPGNPLEGVIRYSMKSNGFLILFKHTKFKLKIQIQDRALHSSNVIETAEYMLDDLRP